MNQAAVGTDQVAADKFRSAGKLPAFADRPPHHRAHASILPRSLPSQRMSLERSVHRVQKIPDSKRLAKNIANAQPQTFDSLVAGQSIRQENHRPIVQRRQLGDQIQPARFTARFRVRGSGLGSRLAPRRRIRPAKRLRLVQVHLGDHQVVGVDEFRVQAGRRVRHAGDVRVEPA